MANLSHDERHVRKLTKVGGTSYSVTIPIEMVRELGWQEHQKVVIKKSGQTLTIQDWKK